MSQRFARQIMQMGIVAQKYKGDYSWIQPPPLGRQGGGTAYRLPPTTATGRLPQVQAQSVSWPSSRTGAVRDYGPSRAELWEWRNADKVVSGLSEVAKGAVWEASKLGQRPSPPAGPADGPHDVGGMKKLPPGVKMASLSAGHKRTSLPSRPKATPLGAGPRPVGRPKPVAERSESTREEIAAGRQEGIGEMGMRRYREGIVEQIGKAMPPYDEAAAKREPIIHPGKDSRNPAQKGMGQVGMNRIRNSLEGLT